MAKIWMIMLLAACAAALGTGRMGQCAQALMQCGDDAVSLMLTLLGSMTVWGGLMEMLAQSGDLDRLGGLLRRLLKPLFPGLEDPACWRAVSMNLAANLLGLGNAATPAGLEASRLLAKQGESGLRALAMLLALNNAGLQLMPTTVITLRAAAGSADPAGVWGPSVIVSAVSAAVAGILMACRNRRREKCGSAVRAGGDQRGGFDGAAGRPKRI